MRHETENNGKRALSRRRCLASVGLLVTCLNGSALSSDARAKQVPSAESELKLRVRVCNYAAVPLRTLAKAELLTARIFQVARIGTVWVDGFPSTGGLSIPAESP